MLIQCKAISKPENPPLQTQKFSNLINTALSFTIWNCVIYNRKSSIVYDTIQRALRPFVLVSVTNTLTFKNSGFPVVVGLLLIGGQTLIRVSV